MRKISLAECQSLCVGICNYVSYATHGSACLGSSRCKRGGNTDWKYVTYVKVEKGEHKGVGENINSNPPDYNKIEILFHYQNIIKI